MNKRKLNGDGGESYRKRRRINTMEMKEKQEDKHAWCKSMIFKHNNNAEDQKQYDKIFKSISESDMIEKMNIPEVIVQVISDCTVGNLLKCWNQKCKGKISFMNVEKFVRKGNRNCSLCGMEQWSSWCGLCNDECTIINQYGIYCQQCRRMFCHQHMDQCGFCDGWWCVECWDLKNNCMACHYCILE